jgi:hypothetical protein
MWDVKNTLVKNVGNGSPKKGGEASEEKEKTAARGKTLTAVFIRGWNGRKRLFERPGSNASYPNAFCASEGFRPVRRTFTIFFKRSNQNGAP